MDERRIQRILRQHVLTDQLMGVDAVPVGDFAVADAQDDAPMQANRSIAPPPREPYQPPAMNRSSADQSQPARPGAPGLPDRPKPAPKTPTRPPATSTAAARPDPSLYAPAAGGEAKMINSSEVEVPVYASPLKKDEKVKRLNVLDVESVQGCEKCGLHESRTQTVFGEGNPNAELMFVGEGPGEQEDLSGRPFVGRAGKKLDEMIAAMGLSRDDVFIANIVKCRPPGNRVPTIVESDACCDYLVQQIRLIQPKALVALGGSSTKYLLQTNTGITKLRGNWHHYDALLPEGPSIPLMPTFHPAFLLRQYTTENRRRVWEDLKKVMDLLGIEPPKKKK